MANKKIVVLKLRELIYTGIFLFFGIVLILLLVAMFSGGHRSDPNSTEENTSSPGADNDTTATFRPGLYTTDLTLAGNTSSLQLLVEADRIVSIDLETEDYITTMYPLIEPALDIIESNLTEGIPLSDITFSMDTQYTGHLLIQALEILFDKATLPEES